VLGFTYGVVWRGDESPLQMIAQRCALAAYLRGEAPEWSPEPRAFIIRCSSLTTGVSVNCFSGLFAES